jgi:hypothetical protein
VSFHLWRNGRLSQQRFRMSRKRFHERRQGYRLLTGVGLGKTRVFEHLSFSAVV